MNKKREAVQELLLKYLKMIEPEGKNVKFYTEKWSKMSDKDFDTWMHNLKDHKTVFQIQAPTFADVMLMACMALMGVDSITDIWKKGE